MNDWDDADLEFDALRDGALRDGAMNDDTENEFDALTGDEIDAPSDDEIDTYTEEAGEEAAASAVSQPALAAVAPLPPRPIPVRDRLVTYLALPGFDEFTALAAVYGELLRTRYAETRLPPDLQELAIRFPDTLHIVAVVTEGDPDTAAVLPIIARLVATSAQLDLRIVEDDDEEDLRPLALLMPDLDMTAALEEWDLPQVFLFDEEWELQAQWGPRPAAADARVDAWLAANPDYEALAGDETPAGLAAHAVLNHTLLYEMRVWYNSGLARACLDEWRDLLTGLLTPDELEANGER